MTTDTPKETYMRVRIYTYLLRRDTYGLFLSSAKFFRIRANAALDKAEDPGQVMDYSYTKQIEQLQQLRRSIADVVTNEKRLELQQNQLVEKITKLDSQARQALEANAKISHAWHCNVKRLL